MKIKFLDGNLEDLSLIVDLNRDEYWKNNYLWDSSSVYERWKSGSWWSDIKLLSWHFKVIKECQGGIIVAIEGDKIIGELDFAKSFDNYLGKQFLRIHIIWILVAKSHRRKGIASRLIKFLKTNINDPIWVEPEDLRSESLYKRSGKVITRISNWEMSSTPTSNSNSFKLYPSDYNNILKSVENGWIPIIGRYYAPKFDLKQLQLSEEVFEYIWGNTEGGSVLRGFLDSTEVYIVLTQFPRIYISPEFRWKDVKSITNQVTLLLFEKGFSAVYLQVYNSTHLEKILIELGFYCTTKNVPVYQLI